MAHSPRTTHSRSPSSASSMASLVPPPRPPPLVAPPPPSTTTTIPPSTNAAAPNPSPRSPVLLPHPASGVIETNKVHLGRSEQGAKMINQYAVVAKIGKGQHGTVYKCLNTTTNDVVAIKAVPRKDKHEDRITLLRRNNIPRHRADQPGLVNRIDNAERQIFKEIAIMKKCDHGQIVSLYEILDDPLKAAVYLVQEYVSGGEIKWRDEDGNPVLTVDQSRRICRDVILGLEYLHYQGIVHRDIKPANLLWTAEHGSVKIADFGVSHYSYAMRLAPNPDAGGQEDPLLSEFNDADLAKAAGSPAFLAPELIWDSTTSESLSFNITPSTSAVLVDPVFRTNDGPSDADTTIPRSTTLSQQISPSSSPSCSRGSPAHTPFNGEESRVTKAIDIWSLGVTLYCLLFGQIPFDGETKFIMYNKIKTSDFSIPPTMGFDKIPTKGRHPPKTDKSEGAVVVRLLERMLQKDYHKRITLPELKRHDWILRDIPKKERWLRETAPEKHGTLSISIDEEEDAITSVRFRWRQNVSRVTNFFLRNKGKDAASRTSSQRPSSELDVTDHSHQVRRSRSEAVHGSEHEGPSRPRIITRNLSKGKGRAGGYSAVEKVNGGVGLFRRRTTDSRNKSMSDLPQNHTVPPSREQSLERDRDRWGVSSSPALNMMKGKGKRTSSLVRSTRRRRSAFFSPISTPMDESERRRAGISRISNWMPRWQRIGNGARSPVSVDDDPHSQHPHHSQQHSHQHHHQHPRAGPSRINERRSTDAVMAGKHTGSASRSRSVAGYHSTFSEVKRNMSWNEVGTGEQQHGVYDGIGVDVFSDSEFDFDSLDEDEYDGDDRVMRIVGAGGVLMPSAHSTGDGFRSGMSSVSLLSSPTSGPGETVYSQGQGPGQSQGQGHSQQVNGLGATRIALSQREHLFHGPEIPAEPNPALLDTVGHEQHRHTHATRHHAVSPLAQTPYVVEERRGVGEGFFGEDEHPYEGDEEGEDEGEFEGTRQRDRERVEDRERERRVGALHVNAQAQGHGHHYRNQTPRSRFTVGGPPSSEHEHDRDTDPFLDEDEEEERGSAESVGNRGLSGATFGGSGGARGVSGSGGLGGRRTRLVYDEDDEDGSSEDEIQHIEVRRRRPSESVTVSRSRSITRAVVMEAQAA